MLLDGRVNHRTCVSVGSVRFTFLPLIYVEKKKTKVVKGLTVVVLIKKKLYIFSLFLSLSEVFYLKREFTLASSGGSAPAMASEKGGSDRKGYLF